MEQEVRERFERIEKNLERMGEHINRMQAQLLTPKIRIDPPRYVQEDLFAARRHAMSKAWFRRMAKRLGIDPDSNVTWENWQ